MSTWPASDPLPSSDLVIDLGAFKETKHQRYERTHSGRRKSRHVNRELYNEFRREARAEKPFVGWDTEGTNVSATPFLFGNSIGSKIARPWISSQAMFDLVLETEARMPDCIHVIYGGEYDFNMMLREMPARNLQALKDHGKTVWDGYKIGHIPRKWFTISKDGYTAKIFDVVSFFGTSYVNALIEHKVGTDEQLARVVEGKQGRSSFTFDDLAFIEPYWRTELALLPELMDHLRDSFYGAGSYISNWHGPGSLARYALTHHHIKEAMNESPPEVHNAARYAFAGGRFESFQAGEYRATVYNADINSAYPYAATFLPNLARGKWRHSNSVDRENISRTSFVVYHIKYEMANTEREGLCLGPQPLFRRHHDDRVTWPQSVTGWYWAPEAWLVRDDPHATFLESWEFVEDDPTDKPFRFIAEDYEHRARLKAMGNPVQLTFKLRINSIYGQTAQRAGWKFYHGAPKFHQLEWAGFITSLCRSMVHEAAVAVWRTGGLISIDTDGIYSTTPIPEASLWNGSGVGLGSWERSEVPGILYWQSGVYYVPEPTESSGWKLSKARGAPKGQIPYAAAQRALKCIAYQMPNLANIYYKRNELVGYRWGLRNGMDEWRFFVTRDRQLRFGGSQYSKRYHNYRGCRKCRGFVDGTLHDLSPNGNGFGYDSHSKMHVLPWESNDHDRPRDPIDMAGEIEVDEIWAEEP